MVTDDRLHIVVCLLSASRHLPGAVEIVDEHRHVVVHRIEHRREAVHFGVIGVS
ncbi:MAG: hypothetical protein ACRDK7_03465 [Solirubrobacteraceae bacterium]